MPRHPPSTGSDDGALFRIHRVSELTGVAEVTLRAWERRHGIPTPRRTSSGYRLYGEREIAQVTEAGGEIASGDPLSFRNGGTVTRRDWATGVSERATRRGPEPHAR